MIDGAGGLAGRGVEGVDADVDARHVEVRGAEAQRDGGARGHRAERAAVVTVEGVVTQAVPLNVARGRRGVVRGDRQDVRRRVVAEGDLRVVGRHVKADVRAVLHAARAVVLVPAFVDGDLGLVSPGGQRGGLEGVGAVAVQVLQPGAQTTRIPVAGAAEFGLEAAGRDRDDGIAVAGNPM